MVLYVLALSSMTSTVAPARNVILMIANMLAPVFTRGGRAERDGDRPCAGPLYRQHRPA